MSLHTGRSIDKTSTGTHSSHRKHTFLTCHSVSGVRGARNSQREVQHRGLLRQPDLTGTGVSRLRPVPALRWGLQEMTRWSTEGAALLESIFTCRVEVHPGPTDSPSDYGHCSGVSLHTFLSWSYMHNTSRLEHCVCRTEAGPLTQDLGQWGNRIRCLFKVCVRLRAVWVSTGSSSHSEFLSLGLAWKEVVFVSSSVSVTD